MAPQMGDGGSAAERSVQGILRRGLWQGAAASLQEARDRGFSLFRNKAHGPTSAAGSPLPPTFSESPPASAGSPPGCCMQAPPQTAAQDWASAWMRPGDDAVALSVTGDGPASFTINPHIWNSYCESFEDHMQGCRQAGAKDRWRFIEGGGAPPCSGAYPLELTGKVPGWSAASLSTQDPDSCDSIDTATRRPWDSKKRLELFVELLQTFEGHEDLSTRLPGSEEDQSDLEDEEVENEEEEEDELQFARPVGAQASESLGQDQDSYNLPGQLRQMHAAQMQFNLEEARLLREELVQATKHLPEQMARRAVEEEARGLRTELLATETAHAQERRLTEQVVEARVCAEQEVRRLQDERRHSNAAVHQVQARLQKLQDAHANLGLAHSCSEEERRTLQLQVWELEGRLQEKDLEKQRIPSLEQELEEVKSRVSELEEAVRKGNAERAKLVSENSGYRDKIIELERLLSEVRASHENANLAVLSHRLQVKELSQEVADERAVAESRDHERFENRSRIDQLLQDLAERHRVEADHTRQHNVHRQQIGRLEEDLAVSNLEHQQLAQSNAELRQGIAKLEGSQGLAAENGRGRTLGEPLMEPSPLGKVRRPSGSELPTWTRPSQLATLSAHGGLPDGLGISASDRVMNCSGLEEPQYAPSETSDPTALSESRRGTWLGSDASFPQSLASELAFAMDKAGQESPMTGHPLYLESMSPKELLQHMSASPEVQAATRELSSTQLHEAPSESERSLASSAHVACMHENASTLEPRLAPRELEALEHSHGSGNLLPAPSDSATSQTSRAWRMQLEPLMAPPETGVHDPRGDSVLDDVRADQKLLLAPSESSGTEPSRVLHRYMAEPAPLMAPLEAVLSDPKGAGLFPWAPSESCASLSSRAGCRELEEPLPLMAPPEAAHPDSRGAGPCRPCASLSGRAARTELDEMVSSTAPLATGVPFPRGVGFLDHVRADQNLLLAPSESSGTEISRVTHRYMSEPAPLMAPPEAGLSDPRGAGLYSRAPSESCASLSSRAACKELDEPVPLIAPPEAGHADHRYTNVPDHVHADHDILLAPSESAGTESGRALRRESEKPVPLLAPPEISGLNFRGARILDHACADQDILLAPSESAGSELSRATLRELEEPFPLLAPPELDAAADTDAADPELAPSESDNASEAGELCREIHAPELQPLVAPPESMICQEQAYGRTTNKVNSTSPGERSALSEKTPDSRRASRTNGYAAPIHCLRRHSQQETEGGVFGRLALQRTSIAPSESRGTSAAGDSRRQSRNLIPEPLLAPSESGTHTSCNFSTYWNTAVKPNAPDDWAFHHNMEFAPSESEELSEADEPKRESRNSIPEPLLAPFEYCTHSSCNFSNFWNTAAKLDTPDDQAHPNMEFAPSESEEPSEANEPGRVDSMAEPNPLVAPPESVDQMPGFMTQGQTSFAPSESSAFSEDACDSRRVSQCSGATLPKPWLAPPESEVPNSHLFSSHRNTCVAPSESDETSAAGESRRSSGRISALEPLHAPPESSASESQELSNHVDVATGLGALESRAAHETEFAPSESDQHSEMGESGWESQAIAEPHPLLAPLELELSSHEAARLSQTSLAPSESSPSEVESCRRSSDGDVGVPNPLIAPLESEVPRSNILVRSSHQSRPFAPSESDDESTTVDSRRGSKVVALEPLQAPPERSIPERHKLRDHQSAAVDHSIEHAPSESEAPADASESTSQAEEDVCHHALLAPPEVDVSQSGMLLRFAHQNTALAPSESETPSVTADSRRDSLDSDVPTLHELWAPPEPGASTTDAFGDIQGPVGRSTTAFR